jgi:hypothetical protein
MAAPGSTAIRVRDENGKTIVVSPDVARDGFLKGAYQPTEARVRVGKGTQTATVDAAEIQSAIDSGWSPITEVQAEDAAIKREESTALGQVRGTAEAAASGLTFGLSDIVLSDLPTMEEFASGTKRGSGDENRKRFAARNEAAGAVGETARLAGEVLPGLLSGGAGFGAAGLRTGLGQTARQGAATAVRRAGFLPAGVEALGAAAERQVIRAFGPGLGARAGGAAARGYIEGAASGVAQEIHESVLGGRDITAERLLASGSMGALFGAGASAAFPLTGALLRKGAKVPTDAIQSVLAKASKASDPANVRPVAEMIGSGLQGKPLSPSRQILGELGKGAEGRRLVNEVAHDLEGAQARSAALIKESTAGMAERIKRVVSGTEGTRAESMRGLLGDVDAGVAQQHIQRSLMGAYEDVMGPMGMQRVERYQGGGPMHKYRLDDAAGALEEAFDDVAKMTDAADMHTRLLKAKRRLQEIAKDTSAADDVGKQTKRFIQERVSKLDDALQSDLFGKAGATYKAVKDADRLVFQSTKNLFDIDRATGMRRGKNPLGRILNGDATNAEVTEFAKRIGNDKYADQMDIADDYFQRQIKAAEIRSEALGDAASKSDVAALKTEYESFKRTMAQQAKVADIADAFKSAGSGSLPGVLSIFGPSGATVSLAMLGGPMGAMVGGALNAFARPGSSLKSIAAVAHLADKIGVDVDGIINRTVSLNPRGAATKSAKVAGRAAQRAGAATARTASAGRGVASREAARLSVAKRNERQKERQRRAEELSDPDVLSRELAQQMFALSDAAPGIAGAAAEKIGLAAMFLRSKLPPETVDPLTGAKVSADEATRQSFDRYYEAVTDPVASLRRLEDGSFTSEHAEALREVWPAMYEEIREKALEGMSERVEKGEVIPYQRRASLGVLLDLPTDVSLTPEFLASMAAQHVQGRAADDAQSAPPQGQRTRKTNFESANKYETPLGRIGRDDT